MSDPAISAILEAGLRVPNSYTPDLTEENAKLPPGPQAPGSDFTNVLDRGSEPPSIPNILEDGETKEPTDTVCTLKDGPAQKLFQSDSVESSDDTTSEKSLARSAGSLDAMSKRKGAVVENVVGAWMERYPNLGVPDIDDKLEGVDADEIDIEEPPGDSGYGSRVRARTAVIRKTQDPILPEFDPPPLKTSSYSTRTQIVNAPPPMVDEITESSTLASSELADLGESLSNPMELPEFESGWCDRGFHVEFARNEREPLFQLRFLGQGLNGPVYETKCKGISLAWKKKFKRKGIGPRERKEIDIMKKLSHHHITKLVGTYTIGKFFGLLVWPVAICDLATLLEDLDAVKEHLDSGTIEDLTDCDVLDRFHALGLPSGNLEELHTAIARRSMRSLGCLTNAVVYFHNHGVKHKDLKPSNILLSTGGGLWVTDFECSTDFSFLTSSVTEEGERGTAKYFAPEIAAHQPCSRAADIFALGCIFLEILWACSKENTLDSLRALRPNEDNLFNCSFHHNLEHRDKWIDGLPKETALDRHLAFEVRQMLEVTPEARPKALELSILLLALEGLNAASSESLLHSACCLPKTPKVSTTEPASNHTSNETFTALPQQPPPTLLPEAFERWEQLSAHWEGLTSYWIRRLENNTEEMAREPLAQQMSRQITDLSAAGANLFHAIVELQRLRASSERKFQRWFYEHRMEQEENLEQRVLLEQALKDEKRRRKIAEDNLRTAEHAAKDLGKRETVGETPEALNLSPNSGSVKPEENASKPYAATVEEAEDSDSAEMCAKELGLPEGRP